MARGETEYRYHFPTTHWSLVGHAGGSGNDAAHRAALNELLSRYLPTLRAHLVIKKRIDVHEADDLLQAFITSKVLERNLLGAAQATRGRFRSLLATALDNFVSNERRRRGAMKRQADSAANLSDSEEQEIRGRNESAARAMDIAWAKQVLTEALRRLEAECEVTGESRRWQVFEARVIRPTIENAAPKDYDEVIRLCGFSSPTQASNALVTAKRAFARILREVISEYACSAGEIEEELRDLRQVLGGGKS